MGIIYSPDKRTSTNDTSKELKEKSEISIEDLKNHHLSEINKKDKIIEDLKKQLEEKTITSAANVNKIKEIKHLDSSSTPYKKYKEQLEVSPNIDSLWGQLVGEVMKRIPDSLEKSNLQSEIQKKISNLSYPND